MVDLQIEDVLGNNNHVLVVPDSTQPVYLLVGRPVLDISSVAYTRVGEELHIGFEKNYPFLKYHEATPCIESKAVGITPRELIKIKENKKKKKIEE
ncbi:hypothetical protein NPIL_109611 [Nephila pilipes]|uniref:Uncharacterized protein n=1 Tax=Nephila pilipes TaxID=299642 RepID=A0A8X6TB58_NEPPI|nr:hypothetical protein NPIL_109611 [Nephila pilipes]